MIVCPLDKGLFVTGSKQVAIKGYDDKRQMTVLLAISKAGELLPPQLIYRN